MRHKLYDQEPKYVRDMLNDSMEKADHIHSCERELIVHLREIDMHRLFTRYGYKSLTGFCNHALQFSRTQTYRIVAEVRRCETSVNIGHKTPSKKNANAENVEKVEYVKFDYNSLEEKG